MPSHEPRQSAQHSVPADALRAIRTALALYLSSAPDDEVASAFREARRAAQRDGVEPARLVEIIVSTWGELADAVGLAPARRADALSAALARCLEAVLEPSPHQRRANGSG